MAGAKKSPFAAGMDEVQKLLDPDLKRLGFRKFTRTYNRTVEIGLVQVINFQMGSHELPQQYVSPVPGWLKPDLYGKFTINLGIYVEEVAQFINPLKPKTSISEPICALRIRLGRLIDPDNQDFWWRLDKPAEQIASDVKGHLLTVGMDFLNRFGNRMAIIEDWVNFNDKEMMTSPRARLDAGIMLATKGDRDRAVVLFREHLAQSPNNPRHEGHVMALAQKLGLNLGI